jgi:hypothetical protein
LCTERFCLGHRRREAVAAVVGIGDDANLH